MNLMFNWVSQNPGTAEQILSPSTVLKQLLSNGKHGDLFLLLGGILYQGAPNIAMKALIIKI